MKLSELYDIPSLSTDTWHEDYSNAVTDIMQFDEIYRVKDLFAEDAPSRLMVHEKLHYTSDGYRAVTVKVLTFDDVPFAAHFTGGRSGRDAKTQHITDTNVWTDARGYLLAEVTKVLAKTLEVTDADLDLMDGFYDAKFAKHKGSYVAVASNFASNEGLLLFDVNSFSHHYHDTDLGQRIRWTSVDEQFSSDLRKELVNGLRDAVIGERIDIDLAYSETQTVYAIAKTGDQTIIHTFDPNGRNFSQGAGMGCFPVGPGNMFECYARLLSGDPITTDLAYIQDVSKAFGIDADAVVSAVSEFLANGGKQVPERLMAIIERDQRVPAELDDKYATYALAYKLHDNPELARLCPGASRKWAKGVIDMIEKHFTEDASSPKI